MTDLRHLEINFVGGGKKRKTRRCRQKIKSRRCLTLVKVWVTEFGRHEGRGALGPEEAPELSEMLDCAPKPNARYESAPGPNV